MICDRGSRVGKPSRHTEENKKLHDDKMAGSITVITDPDELARLQQECTPPSDIKVRHGLGTTYERGLFNNRKQRRGFGNGRQKNIY